MVVLVTGDRNWRDGDMIRTALWNHFNDTLIHGDARGADRIAAGIAERRGMSVIPFPAKWDEHGKAAGPIRNEEMLQALLKARERGRPVTVHAFHDDLEASKGTADMVHRARRAGFDVHVHTHGLRDTPGGRTDGAGP
jgi:imidazolonepropionase-like amidohydrolase